jgi:hypothetical protein
MTQDEDQLRLLSIFHYVVGGLAGLCALFPIFHLAFGLALIFAPELFQSKGGPPPSWLGWLLVGVAAAIIVLGWIFAALVLAAGRCLAKRKLYTFCLVMGAVECLFMPFGTILGVFTIVVLLRESAKQLFEGARDSA